MKDILVAIIAHFWPISFLGALWLFRKQIANLLIVISTAFGKFNQLSIQHKEIVLAATVTNPQATSSEREPNEGSLADSLLRAEHGEESNPELEAERDAAIGYGKNIISVQHFERNVRSDLERLRFSLGETETSDLLIRQLAMQTCLVAFEKSYRFILGSQLRALSFLNERGQLPSEIVRTFYEDAVASHSEIYADFSFDRWSIFLISRLLILKEEDSFVLTSHGKEFLLWIVNEGLSMSKPA